MKTFPQEHELIGFFEVEPKVLDPAVPWAYNHLEFQTHNRSEDIKCIIEPGYRILQLELTRGDQRVVSLDLKNVEALRVEQEGDRELLIAEFDSGLGEVRFSLRPETQLSVYREIKNRSRRLTSVCSWRCRLTGATAFAYW